MPASPPDPGAPFARWLRERMAERGVSGADLARAVGVTRTVVSGWRLGAVLPRPPMLERVAAALGADLAAVLAKAGGRAHRSTPLGRRLGREAARRGLTLAELADRAGVGRTVLMAWARGGAAPDPEAVARLAAALGVGPAEMERWAEGGR